VAVAEFGLQIRRRRGSPVSDLDKMQGCDEEVSF
jgi:hypothetical protein